MATALDWLQERWSRERLASREVEARVASEDRETDSQLQAAGSDFVMKIPETRHKAAG
jgi:hypothetical protein